MRDDLRDWKLVLIHAPADLTTFFGCVLIAITATYIYRYGKFKGLEIVYPGLWTAGAAFVFFFGTTRALSFAEVVFGGLNLYVGISKVCTAICCLWFGYGLWKAKDDIVQIGRILAMIDSRDGQKER